MAGNDTIFGKIIRREIPADIVYENQDVLAFRDLAPQAPVHVLFIPKHDAIATLDGLQPGNAELVGKLVLAAADYARQEGFAQNGYRVVMNCREDAGDRFHYPPSRWQARGLALVRPARSPPGSSPHEKSRSMSGLPLLSGWSYHQPQRPQRGPQNGS